MTNYKQILNEIMSFYSPDEQDLIYFAYTLAKESLRNKVRENGHPFLEHPLGVAYIVSKEIGLDAESVVAIFIHEAIRFNEDLIKSIPEGSIPANIMEMAVSLNKIAAIQPKDTKLEAENYKKLIASYSNDPRVVIIKLADRLDVMRNIYLLPAESQKKKVSETILLYIPIAHQLGLYNLKAELEDIYFQCSEKENYRMITNLLKATEADRQKLFEKFTESVRHKLEEEHFKFQIKSRTKAAYSIWKKMQKQDIPFEKVEDIFAIRIIIDCPKEEEIAQCWKVFSIVTENNTQDTSRLRNWLDKPKPNGYQSLHTTVTTPEGNTVEIQIRSKRMDDIAENGHASHWSYKGIHEDRGLANWLANVKTAMNSNEKSNYQLVSKFIDEEVLVFSPTGELRRLKAGACVLDYAFDIHTNLGLSCTGAKINGKVASIREKLKTGDVVEIIRSKNIQKPNPDWLNFVVSSKARAKIKQKLRENILKTSLDGREILERRLKNWKLELNDEDLAALCKKYKYANINDLFAAIGDESLDPQEIKDYLNKKEEENAEENTAQENAENSKAAPAAPQAASNDYLVIDDKLGNLSYTLSKCCNPVYGDEVFAFISATGGMKIHRVSCPNATRLLNNYPHRVQRVKWRKDVNTSNFTSRISVKADDRSVMNEVADVLNSLGVHINQGEFAERETKKSTSYIFNIQIHINNNKQLDRAITAIKRIKGVISVSRA